MAEIVASVIQHYNANATIHAAFGNRIWGNKIPDLPGGGAQPYPYARMREISNANLYSHKGYSGRHVMIQIDIYDDDEAGANSNSEIMRSSLDGYKGMIGEIDAGMVKASRGPQTWNSDVRNYWRIVELEIMTNG